MITTTLEGAASLALKLTGKTWTWEKASGRVTSPSLLRFLSVVAPWKGVRGGGTYSSEFLAESLLSSLLFVVGT